MADFSGGAAISSGFRLIGRNPGAVLAWGVAYVAIAILPQFLMMWHVLPDLLTFYHDAFANAQAGTPPSSDPEFMRIQGEISRYQPIQIVLGVVALAVVNSAIYRAVLEPKNKAWAYLRLGKQELWVGLTTVVFYIALVVAMVAAMIPAIIVGAVAASGPSWTSGLIVFLLACGALFFVIWVILRLSLAAPMSFAQKNFRLFESWRLTQGLGWKLFGVALAIGCIVIALELALMVVAFTLISATGVAHADQIQAFFQHPPTDLAVRAIPWLAGICGVYAILCGLMFPILTAPFATIYRELSGETDTQVF